MLLAYNISSCIDLKLRWWAKTKRHTGCEIAAAEKTRQVGIDRHFAFDFTAIQQAIQNADKTLFASRSRKPCLVLWVLQCGAFIRLKVKRIAKLTFKGDDKRKVESRFMYRPLIIFNCQRFDSSSQPQNIRLNAVWSTFEIFSSFSSCIISYSLPQQQINCRN